MRAGSLGQPISRRSWYVILGLAFGLHNSEEWLLAPLVLQFMRSDAPGFLRDVYAGITVSELQGILLLLSAVLLVVIATATVFPAAAASAVAVMVMAALLGLNAVFHIVLFIQPESTYLASSRPSWSVFLLQPHCLFKPDGSGGRLDRRSGPSCRSPFSRTGRYSTRSSK